MEEQKKGQEQELATVLPRWAAELLQRAASHPDAFARRCRIDDAAAEIRRVCPEFFRRG